VHIGVALEMARNPHNKWRRLRASSKRGLR